MDNLPTLRGFGDSAVVPIGKVKLRVLIDYVDVELFAYVVSATLLPADILIGQSLTELGDDRAYKTDSQLTLYQTTTNKTNSVAITTVLLTNDCEMKGDTVVKVNSL